MRVFLDCDECDFEDLRQHVGFVDYVRDRADADFHVLVTTQRTGGGGLSWIVEFIGAGTFRGHTHALRFDTSATMTDDERRVAFTRIFKLGLATVAAGTSAAPQLDLVWTAPAGNLTVPPRDPWNYWVFRINSNGSVEGEQSSTSRSQVMRLSANRTTDRWKLGLNGRGDLRRDTFVLDDGETVRSDRHSWNLNGRAVKSLGRRWAAGVTGSLSHSSYSNLDRGISLAPAVEFNVFPYAESSRRSLVVQYAAGLRANTYSQPTIYDRTRDTFARHALVAELGLRQPWGSMRLFSSLSQQVRHPDLYRAEINGEADVRLFKGLSFNVFAEYSKIKNQISLPKEDASAEEVLLRLRQLATGYSYQVSFGISYRFGSIFNNVVNPRFDNASF